MLAVSVCCSFGGPLLYGFPVVAVFLDFVMISEQEIIVFLSKQFGSVNQRQIKLINLINK